MTNPATPTLLPRVISTGGTFEKVYNPRDGSLNFNSSCVPALLARAGVVCPSTTLMLIDSLDMTDTHRAQIAAACREAIETHIVIVHGTDTMTETAQHLASCQLAKAIVLTGAMIPASINNSDAFFNLGHAVAAAGAVTQGVWICMNGQTFAWDNVRKNRDAGRFETLTNRS